jgi:5'(3')-deoxyribonucleotidase
MIFLIDVDGVLADFHTMFFETARTLLGRPLVKSDSYKEWDIARALNLSSTEEEMVYDVLDQPGVAENMPELPGAIAGVKSIAEHAEVFFLTSPMRSSRTWVYDRDRWLEKKFGTEQGGKIVSTHYKYLVTNGDVFIDDKVTHLEQWQESRAKCPGPFLPICWAQPYNTDSSVFRTDSWEAVAELAKKGLPSEGSGG